ncbi:MAG: hypothetical protein U5K33_06645 [Halofilum sp. (in: g-proteobacteria)]|nr:hypothetical protein [Halofilum sp. (in: g-proteobacteria)]
MSIARTLGRHGVPVDVVSPRPGGRVPRSRWIRRKLSLDTSNSAPDERAAALVRAIEQEGYDHLVVTSDSGLRLIDRCREALPANVRQSVPSAEVTATVLDKAASMRLASDAGLDVPAAWMLPDPATLSAREPELRFPLIGKPADKRVSEPFKIRYFEDVAKPARQLRERSRLRAQHPVPGVRAR